MKGKAEEPSIRTALDWWPEWRDKWTPIGWKDHMFRFNVLHNGTVHAEPNCGARTARWAGEGVQITFGSLAVQRDDGSVLQGWNECAAPVLWSEYAKEGLLIRTQIFAHVPGGKRAASGVEPLYAWIRLSIHGALEGLKLPKSIEISLRLNAPHIWLRMTRAANLNYDVEKSRYPRALASDRPDYDSVHGFRLVEGDGRVRMGVAGGQTCRVSFHTNSPTEKDSELIVELPGQLGAHADLLLPMLPSERSMFDAELAGGFDAALDEAVRFWSDEPQTAARLECAEEHVNRVISRQVKLAGTIAERNPDTDICSLLTASWLYTMVWATPTAMAAIFTLDAMGRHCDVDRYLDMYRREQGTVVPPGRAFTAHPGYLGVPASLRSVDWVTDHGAILWAASQHVLTAGGKERENRWLPAIVRACEFIRDARQITDHGGVPGLLPPAVSTDEGSEVQGVWSDGWNYKGLVTAVRLLRRLSHPRADEFDKEARQYRETFLSAIRARAATGPQWTDSRGRRVPFAPFSMCGDADAHIRHAFYLDAGPLFLVFSELMEANDPLMRAATRWFREGPQTKFFRPDSDFWQPSCLVHEMSSCEPCYSWNVFHSHRLGDRARYLECMYSQFAGAYSHQTLAACETRGGISGMCACIPAPYLARLAVIDDQISRDDLHLLRLMPTAWLRKRAGSRFESMPTEFGPVSLRVLLADSGRELRVAFRARFRCKPRKIVLHVPPIEGIARVRWNGQLLPWSRKQDRISVKP